MAGVQGDVRDRRTRNECMDGATVDGHASDSACIVPKEGRPIGSKISHPDVRRRLPENDWRAATERNALDLGYSDAGSIIVSDEVAVIGSSDVSPDNTTEVEVHRT